MRSDKAAKTDLDRRYYHVERWMPLVFSYYSANMGGYVQAINFMLIIHVAFIC